MLLGLLSSHLLPDLPRGLFPSGCRTKTTYAFQRPPIRATCPPPSHRSCSDYQINTWWAEQMMKQIFMDCRSVSCYSSLNVRDQVHTFSSIHFPVTLHNLCQSRRLFFLKDDSIINCLQMTCWVDCSMSEDCGEFLWTDNSKVYQAQIISEMECAQRSEV